MVRISAVSALDAWLEERCGFEDGHLTRVEQSPDGAVTLEFERTRTTASSVCGTPTAA